MGNGNDSIVVKHSSMEFMRDRVAQTAQENMNVIGELINRLGKHREEFVGVAAQAFQDLERQYQEAKGQMAELLNRQGVNIDEAGQAYTATDRKAAGYF